MSPVTGLRVEIVRSRQALAAMAAGVRTAPGSTVRRVLAGGRPALEVTGSAATDRVLVHLHGGGFRAGTPEGARGLASYLAVDGGPRVLLPAYRLAPEHPFPAAVQDVVAVLDELRAAGVAPGRIAVLGESAGANLAAAALLAAGRAGNGPAAGALVLLSPWLDLTASGGSYRRNREHDRAFGHEAARFSAGLYLGVDPEGVATAAAGADPLASPVRAGPDDLAGLPPTLVQVSSTEVVHDEAVEFARRLNAAGVEVRLDVWPGEQHCWQLGVPDSPTAGAAVREVRNFLGERFP
jgi:monoterpene epsilon-lactone hydrolase